MTAWQLCHNMHSQILQCHFHVVPVSTNNLPSQSFIWFVWVAVMLFKGNILQTQRTCFAVVSDGPVLQTRCQSASVSLALSLNTSGCIMLPSLRFFIASSSCFLFLRSRWQSGPNCSLAVLSRKAWVSWLEYDKPSSYPSILLFLFLFRPPTHWYGLKVIAHLIARLCHKCVASPRFGEKWNPNLEVKFAGVKILVMLSTGGCGDFGIGIINFGQIIKKVIK